MSIKIILATLIMNVLVGEQNYSTYSGTQTPDLLTCRGSYLYKYNFEKNAGTCYWRTESVLNS